MKKFLILIFILCISVFCSQAFAQRDGFFSGNSNSGHESPNQEPQQEEYQPILSTVKDIDAEQGKMLANTYRLLIFDKDHPASANSPGGGTVFRIHKNWFLTCAHHHPFMGLNTEHKPVLEAGVSVRERPNAPGSTAPFDLVLDMTVTGDEANGRVYLFNPKLQLDSSNNGRGDDLALIYVSSKDPNEKSFKAAKKEIKETKENLKTLQGMFPMDFLEKMENYVNTTHRKVSSDWNSFINNKIYPFKLFVLEENTVINELGYPGATSYYFPLATYYIHQDGDDGLVKFKFEPIGTHKGTHAIFYKRVNNLIPGTSGSPMMYGNFIVSVDSATNCSPMFTDKFSKWVKDKMGSDYSPMFVRPNNSGGGTPVQVQTDHNWNNAAPDGP